MKRACSPQVRAQSATPRRHAVTARAIACRACHPDADDFLEEAGRTGRRRIQGLLITAAPQQPVACYRPLEDNPLRFRNMDSRHAALDAAVCRRKKPGTSGRARRRRESSRNIRHHAAANRAAIVWNAAARAAGRLLATEFDAVLCSTAAATNCVKPLMMPVRAMYDYYDELASSRQQGFEMLFNEACPCVARPWVLRESASGSRKHDRPWLCPAMLVALFTLAWRGCETVKNRRGDQNPDIQVGVGRPVFAGDITLLTEPDANINADGAAVAWTCSWFIWSDDSKFQAADYDQIATTALPDALGKTISITISACCPDTMKTLPLVVKLDEKTQFIGVRLPIFPTTIHGMEANRTGRRTGHNYRLLVHIRQSSIEMKKRMINDGNHAKQGDVAGRNADVRTISSSSTITIM